MAKLIGHYFNAKAGGFSTFEVDGLKETPKQYAKTKETKETFPRFSYEYWSVLPKSELGALRQPSHGVYTMYELQEDMPHFRKLVIERLTRAAARERESHEVALFLLEYASGTSPEDAPAKQYDTIAVDFDGTLCEYRFPDIGKPKPLVIAFIKGHAARGSKIILHTCRENGTRRALLDEAVEFCAAYGIPLYAVNENPENTYPEQYGANTTGRKVYADLYIDDKAVNTADIEREESLREAGAGTGQYADNPTTKQALEYGA